MASDDLRRQLMDVLSREGFRPEPYSDGDIHFKYQGGNYYIFTNDDDREFFQIVYPGFWSIGSDEELDRFLRAAARACRETKVAKVYPHADLKNASITAEIFISDISQVQPVLNRMLSCMSTSLDMFRTEMRRLSEPSG